MVPTRLQRDFATLDRVDEAIARDYGREARIVAVDVVDVGGFAGFFAKRTFRVTIELPDPAMPERAAAGPSASAASSATPTVFGIDALLEAAEEFELEERLPQPSTVSAPFEQVYSGLLDYTRPSSVPASTPAPRPTLLSHPRWVAPLTGAGDLVVVLGIGRDVLPVARRIGSMVGSLSVYGVTGAAPGDAENRRGVVKDRAHAVMNGHAVALAVEMEPTHVIDMARAILALGPDQVMAVVDASRKPEDTERWISAVRTVLPIDAMLVIGVDETATPQTIDVLDLPRGVADVLD